MYQAQAGSQEEMMLEMMCGDDAWLSYSVLHEALTGRMATTIQVDCLEHIVS
jgi:hypothetical protein